MKKPNRGSIEHRSFAGELRAAKEKDFVLTGYAASFNTLSRDLGGYKERLAPGCFKRSLAAGGDVKALFNHDPSKILGRLENGTLSVEEDSRGLKFRCQLNPASQTHRDIYESVKRGDINECSFAFTVNGDGGEDWSEATDERGQRFIRRTITDCNLLDVSCVTNPAYSGATTVQARSADYTSTPNGAALAALDAENKRKAEEIRTMIFQTCDAFIIPDYVEGQPWEATPVFFTPEQREAHITRQLREKCDEIGRQIFKDDVRAEFGL